MVDSGERNTVARRLDLRGMLRRMGRHDATEGPGRFTSLISLAPFGSEVIAWIISRPFFCRGLPSQLHPSSGLRIARRNFSDTVRQSSRQSPLRPHREFPLGGVQLARRRLSDFEASGDGRFRAGFPRDGSRRPGYRHLSFPSFGKVRRDRSSGS
jgi:hypothetical protein